MNTNTETRRGCADRRESAKVGKQVVVVVVERMTTTCFERDCDFHCH